MVRATSSGRVRRWCGLRRRAISMIFSWFGIWRSALESVTPARMALAVMPAGASSTASWRMCDSRMALAARSKNGRPKRLPLANEAIRALKNLPSYGASAHLFPADRANVGFKGKQEYLRDIRKPFQKACERAGIQNLRIHDLRHMAATILFLRRIPEAIIRKLAGHRSRELERYE